MRRMCLAESAILSQFQFVRMLFLIFFGRIIALLAFAAGKYDYFSQFVFLPPAL
jgi:hypothetical protein